MAADINALVESLRSLGFTQYEAQAYVALLRHGAQTGYSLANCSDVPQPKAYETLGRLERRGVVVRTESDPARFTAVPAADVLDRVEADHARLIERSRRQAEHLHNRQDTSVCAITKLCARQAVVEQAVTLLEAASTKVYLSGHSAELTDLARTVAAAEHRGVEVILIYFGKRPFLHSGPAFRHSSTEAFVYPHHQAHHVAVVVDSHHAMWATAPDGHSWDGVVADNPAIASLIKLYIRHDIFVQRIYTDLRDELRAVYGSGLERLGDFASPAPADSRPQAKRRRPTAS